MIKDLVKFASKEKPLHLQEVTATWKWIIASAKNYSL